MRGLDPGRDWEALRAGFAWDLPARCNIAWDCCDRWPADRLALVTPARPWRYGELRAASCQLAHALAAWGVARGDRVAVLLPQGAELLIAHLAAYRLGAIAVPLTQLFGADALAVRLADSGARVVVTDAGCLAKLPPLPLVLSVDGPGAGALGFWSFLAPGRGTGGVVATGPDDPALLSYTSGTTGPPKGALHGHRVLAGHLPGVRLTHGFAPRPGDRFWTPADWAWMGGLCNIALPALALGVPLVAERMERFDPEAAVALMARHGVRNAFLPPTALKLMRAAGVGAVPGLRSVASGGESLGAELVGWGEATFGLTIAEFYGQTECNLVLGNCPGVLAVRPGSTGRAIPGTEVAILGPDGAAVAPGAAGEIALRASAAMFLGYWNAAPFTGPWLRTGDEGAMDADGYVWFAGRTDDVITSSGYRIGPAEIEHCLTAHPRVALAAVVGVPDPVRTMSLRAHVVATPGPMAGLEAALIAHVRARLGPHMAPRAVVFADSLPTTTTGKLLRRALRPDPPPATGGG